MMLQTRLATGCDASRRRSPSARDRGSPAARRLAISRVNDSRLAWETFVCAGGGAEAAVLVVVPLVSAEPKSRDSRDPDAALETCSLTATGDRPCDAS